MRTPNAEDFRKQMPACCSVMYTEMQEGDEVMEKPLSVGCESHDSIQVATIDYLST